MRKTSSAATESSESGIVRYLKPMIIGLLSGVTTCFVFLCIFAFIVSSRDIPQAMISTLALVAGGLGGFISGFVASKLVRTRGLLVGLICGVVLFLIVLLASVATLKTSFGPIIFVKMTVIVIASAIGGVLGVNSRSKRRR